MDQVCPQLSKCPLFNELKHTAETWQMVYCKSTRGGFKACQRFILKSQGQDVPALLLPTGKLLHAG